MKAAVCLALGLLLAACSDSTGATGGVRVTTDASAYVRSGGPDGYAVVDFTVKNLGSTAIALLDCGGSVAPADLQQRQGAEWVTVGGPFCPLPIAEPYPRIVAPGEAGEGMTMVRAAGKYRVRVPVSGSGDEDPARYAVSPTFVVY